MAPHSNSVPTIVEASSETEQITSAESVSPEAAHSIDSGASLDDLFAQLKQETIPVKENRDEFQEIRKKVSKLPKINSKLEENISKATETSKKEISRISDPIPVKKDTSKKEDAGSKWFHMKQPEITPQLRRDLMVIKQRAALDPKRHYKKDKWEIPKFFETGTIIEGNTEHYSKMKKRDRGRTLVEEVLNDDNTKKYFKRVYSDIQKNSTSGRKAHYKKVKMMRKKY